MSFQKTSRLADRSAQSKLKDLGEWQLLRRLIRPQLKTGLNIVIPNGDDAFCAKIRHPLVVTTDTLIEDTHFKILKKSNININKQYEYLGERAMRVNLSDLAAMGEVAPRMAFVTLGVHGDIPVDYVEKIYAGMRKITQNYGYLICGGDIIRSDKSIISITLLGESPHPERLLRRDRVREGELLVVSGPLGQSAAGLWLWGQAQKGQKIRFSGAQDLVLRHLRGMARLDVGSKLAGFGVRAALDTSDDLATSCQILAWQSKVGVELFMEDWPVPAVLQRAGRAAKMDPRQWMLYGGEDYELLFTVPEKNGSKLLRAFPQAWVVGRIRSRRFGLKARWNGQARAFTDIFSDSRFRHF